MPDPIARKRLKKKMLDRWENESGSKTQRAETEARRFRGAPTLRSCDETFRSHARRGVIWQSSTLRWSRPGHWGSHL